MTQGEFCARLRKSLRRATDTEWQSVRREFVGHIEDRAEDFKRAGFPPEEAQERAVAAMGEPEEIGQALNAQLSPFWLIVSRVSTVCIVLLCFGLLASLTGFFRVYENLQARFAPGGGFRGPEAGYVRQEVDARMSLRSGDILRVYWVDVDPKEGLAEIRYCLYDENLLGYVADNVDVFIQAQAPDGTWDKYSGGGQGSAGVLYWGLSDVPVERGQEYIPLRYDRFGDHLTLDVPLDWEAIA